MIVFECSHNNVVPDQALIPATGTALVMEFAASIDEDARPQFDIASKFRVERLE